MPVPDRTARWPERLIALARTASETGSDRALADLWVLLNLTLRVHIRAQGRRRAPLAREDVEDLASQKTLELVYQFDCGKWKPGASSPGEVVRFVSSVARNGVVDWLRRRGRVDPGTMNTVDGKADGVRTSDSAERREFARALVDCVGRLKESHRCIWIFRVLYEMSGKRIAAHPEVRLRPGNVNVIMNRARKRVERCLEEKGYRADDLPSGCFADIWEAFRMESFVRPDENMP